MTWNPNGVVTINGTDFTGDTLHDVQINYGRTSIWDQARAGYANIDIVNLANTDLGLNVNQTVVIKVENSTGSLVTIFTGKSTSISNKISKTGSLGTVVIQTITAISPLAEMSRKVIGGSDYPKEMDTARMSRILTEAGVTVDVIDSPAVYEFHSRPADAGDAYSIAAKYAQMAFGYIYDTADGKVGYANESRRFIDQRDNGYTTINNNQVLSNGLNSQKSISDIMNDLSLSYKNGNIVTSEDAYSQATYGQVGAKISTELETSIDAQTQADRFIGLRAIPKTSLSSFTVQLDSDNVGNTLRDKLISMKMGMPIRLGSLPIGIKNAVYSGFVEGWTISFNRSQYSVNIRSSDASYSVTPTRWQDVQPTLAWSGVGSTVQWFSYDD